MIGRPHRAGVRVLGALAIAAAAAAVAPRPARAGAPPQNGITQRNTITHTVKRGDTLQLLAAEYYGDRRYAVFIMVANHITHPRPLRPGEKLRIPVDRQVTASVGDTLPALAATYLGDERRAKFLAEFNDLSPDATLAAGQTIRLPFHVTYKATTVESLASIAQAYFGDPKQAELLKEYNFLDTDTIQPGQSIVVPIHRVRVRPSRLPPPDPESQARVKKRREMQALARRLLPAAQTAWRAGDYALVKRELIKIDTDYLDADMAAYVGVLLGGAYIAFGDRDSALATFRKVIERAPHYKISAYHFSPKVLVVWKSAGGAVDTKSR